MPSTLALLRVFYFRLDSIRVAMPVMNVRRVRVAVLQRSMCVLVRVRLARRVAWAVRVLMVLVVPVTMCV